MDLVLDDDERKIGTRVKSVQIFSTKKTVQKYLVLIFDFNAYRLGMAIEGKLHRSILPQTLLKHVISLVKENRAFFAKQISREDIKCDRNIHDNLNENESASSLLKEFAGYFSETDYGKVQEGGTKKGKARRKKEERLQKKKYQKASVEADVDEKDGSQRKGKQERQRPNYFAAVQIIEPQIRMKFVEIQDKIRKKSEENYGSAFVGVEKSHITLMVMHLSDASMIEKAKLSLERCLPVLQETFSNSALKLDIEGISAFSGGRVLYACVKPSQELNFLAGEIKRQMEAESIISTDSPSRSFNPHLTIMKFKGKTRKKVKPEVYSSFAEESFGTQEIKSIQLCRMDQKREDGYYMVDHEIFFVDSD